MKRSTLFITSMLLVVLTGCSAVSGNEKNNSNITEGYEKEETAKVYDVSTEETQNENDRIDSVVIAENTWAYDVMDPFVVMEHSDYFFKVRVKTKEKTKYFIKNTTMPCSTYNLEVLDVLQNDDGIVSKNIKLAVNGGLVSMQEYVDSMDEETKQKTKTDKLTKKELKETVLIKDDAYYELQQGQEYYILVRDLTKDENYKGYYGMPVGGYGVFEEKDGAYINVLTDCIFDIQK